MNRALVCFFGFALARVWWLGPWACPPLAGAGAASGPSLAAGLGARGLAHARGRPPGHGRHPGAASWTTSQRDTGPSIPVVAYAAHARKNQAPYIYTLRISLS